MYCVYARGTFEWTQETSITFTTFSKSQGTSRWNSCLDTIAGLASTEFREDGNHNFTFHCIQELSYVDVNLLMLAFLVGVQKDRSVTSHLPEIHVHAVIPALSRIFVGHDGINTATTMPILHDLVVVRLWCDGLLRRRAALLTRVVDHEVDVSCTANVSCRL